METNVYPRVLGWPMLEKAGGCHPSTGIQRRESFISSDLPSRSQDEGGSQESSQDNQPELASFAPRPGLMLGYQFLSVPPFLVMFHEISLLWLINKNGNTETGNRCVISKINPQVQGTHDYCHSFVPSLVGRQVTDTEHTEGGRFTPVLLHWGGRARRFAVSSRPAWMTYSIQGHPGL